MSVIIKKQGKDWIIGGSFTERVQVLASVKSLYETKDTRNKWLRKRSYDMDALNRLWDSGLFTLKALEEATGVSRKTLRVWLRTNQDSERPRGRIYPGHYAALIGRLRAERVNPSSDIEEFIETLVKEGSTEFLVRAVLRKEKKEEEKPRGTRRVRRAHRPDDEGHPEGGEDFREDHDTHQADDRPGDGEVLLELVDVGDLQEPAPRDETPEPRPAEVKGKQPLDTYVDDQGRTVTIDECGTEIIGYDWNPLDGFDPDETGDSLLQRGDDEEGSGGLPGLPPVGAPWEQAEEAES